MYSTTNTPANWLNYPAWTKTIELIANQ